MKKVTIGLCVKNSENEVNLALKSIYLQDYPHELMKLIVVDDGCTDNTIPIVSDFSSKIDIETMILVSGGKGLATSRQIAVNNAEGDYIVWVDDDFSLPTDYVRKQIEFMEKNSTMGAACPSVTRTVTNSFTSIGYSLFSLQSNHPNTIGTGGAIFRLKAIAEVNGFDTQITGAGEDRDISYRIKGAGWMLAINSSALLKRDVPPMTLGALWKRHNWYGHACHLLFHKNGERRLLFDTHPFKTFLGGIKEAYQVYRITREKNAIFIPFFKAFISFAELFGFIRAHIKGYGHFSN
ncbi:MAG: glycosyltransferase [Nitrososphaerota archaeon]|jgi:glycosyltransferase involved in cell wall biosynthesis|nr:glycosyltransferase [Nitrososphaerota archaeon]